MKRVALSLAVLLALTVHGQDAAVQQQPSINLPAELDRVLRDYENGWMKGDGKALASLFTIDGYVMQPNSHPVKGREAIEKAYQGGGGPLALRAFAFGMDGGVAYILGGFASKQGDPDRGKFTLTLRRVEGKWLIASDMDSGNQPRR